MAVDWTKPLRLGTDHAEHVRSTCSRGNLSEIVVVTDLEGYQETWAYTKTGDVPGRPDLSLVNVPETVDENHITIQFRAKENTHG